MKILHIISSGGMYGAEAVILNLSAALNSNQADESLVGVFANHGETSVPLHTAARNQGITSHLLPCRGQIDLSVAPAIRALALQARADVVHAHGYKADIYAWLALRQTAIPLVSTCHTWYDTDLAVRIYGALDRRVLRRYAGVVAVSNEVSQKLLDAGVSPSKISLIRNGIALEPFAGAPRNQAHETPGQSLRVGLVGRLSPEKGVDLFIRAAASVLASRPSTTFVIVGDGPDYEKLRALITELKLTGRVALLGRCEDMPALYASLDLLVSASRQEGLPVALLEGMASALPLIATRVGAVPSAVQDGVTGLLLPPEDVPALSTAMLALLGDPARRFELGQAGRQRIQADFSSQRMAEEYQAFYRHVLAPGPRS